MRLSPDQIDTIRATAREIFGPEARIWLFGSRLDDKARGGDLDLMFELSEPIDNPALLAARLSARISRRMHGRKVDILLAAPNLRRLPIHDIAFTEGRVL